MEEVRYQGGHGTGNRKVWDGMGRYCSKQAGSWLGPSAGTMCSSNISRPGVLVKRGAKIQCQLKVSCLP
jgi:hypothetical protein